MSGTNDASDTDVERASSQLNEGLKSCRTVLESYRVMLNGPAEAEPEEPPPARNDNQA